MGRFRRAVAQADPDGVELARAAALAERGMRCYREPDGMAVVAARLAAEDAELVFTALTALAGPATAAAPRIEVRRADALVELAGRALDDPELATLHRRRPHISVTIDLATLLGLAEHPGELAGDGPIPASAARALTSTTGCPGRAEGPIGTTSDRCAGVTTGSRPTPAGSCGATPTPA